MDVADEPPAHAPPKGMWSQRRRIVLAIVSCTGLLLVVLAVMRGTSPVQGQPIQRPSGAPTATQYVRVEPGDMSFARASAVAEELSGERSVLSGLHLATVTSEFGTTELLSWAGFGLAESGGFPEVCFATRSAHVGDVINCSSLAGTFGIPTVHLGESGGVAFAKIEGASAVVKWALVTTDSGVTVVAPFVDGHSYLEWSKGTSGSASKMQVLKADLQEFWSEEY